MSRLLLGILSRLLLGVMSRLFVMGFSYPRVSDLRCLLMLAYMWRFVSVLWFLVWKYWHAIVLLVLTSAYTMSHRVF